MTKRIEIEYELKAEEEEDDDIQDYKKPWVGLTDEESVEIQKISTCYEQAVELTEAKLRSKNT